MSTRNMEIAQTILQQLGGGRFKVMTGAKNFSAIENGLSFHLPRGAADGGIKYVTITLNAMDTYDVKYQKTKVNNEGVKRAKEQGLSPAMAKHFATVDIIDVATDEGIYADMLQDRFTEITGLYTSL